MAIKNVICNMGRVLMHGNIATPGLRSLSPLQEKDLPLALLTNAPRRPARNWRIASQPQALKYQRASFIPQQ
jgi:ribonucleotide monophosphatase NagD (HAD superfamily)